MRRQEAVEVMKEIGASCKLLNPKAISLELLTGVAGHYEIHIKGSVDSENWQCLKSIARKYDLGIKLSDQTLIIFRPADKKNGKITQV
jgi:hypothetical protein